MPPRNDDAAVRCRRAIPPCDGAGSAQMARWLDGVQQGDELRGARGSDGVRTTLASGEPALSVRVRCGMVCGDVQSDARHTDVATTGQELRLSPTA
eukprot:808629-Prymnesium_polylepis.2